MTNEEKLERIKKLISELEEYITKIESASIPENPTHEPDVPIPLDSRVPFQEAIHPTEGIEEEPAAETQVIETKQQPEDETPAPDPEPEIPEIIDVPQFAEGQGINVQEEIQDDDIPSIGVPDIEVPEIDVPDIDLPFGDAETEPRTDVMVSKPDIDDADDVPPPLPDYSFPQKEKEDVQETSLPGPPVPIEETEMVEHQEEDPQPEQAKKPDPAPAIIIQESISLETVKECKEVLTEYRNEIENAMPVLISFISDTGKKALYMAKDIAAARIFVGEDLKRVKEDIDPIDRTKEAYIYVGNEDCVYKPTPQEQLNKDETFKGEADSQGKLYVYEGDFHSIIYNELTGRTARWDIFNLSDAKLCETAFEPEKYVITDEERKKYLKSSASDKGPKNTLGKIFSIKK